jgi:putative ABC transport system permease protein
MGEPRVFDLDQHLRAAWRVVRCHPWFALTLSGSIALSSGFTGTALTLARALTTPIVTGPSAPANLVAIYRRSPDGEYQPATVRDLAVVKAQQTLVSSAGAAARARLATVRVGEALFEVRLSTARGELFEALEMPSSDGRLLASADATATPSPMVVSRAFWERAFEADGTRIGTAVTVDGLDHVIVGVAPSGFDGFELGRPTEAWALVPDDEAGTRELSSELAIVARLKPGRSLADLRASLPTLDVVPFARVDPAYRQRLEPIALALMLAGAMVLVAGAVSVASLLVSRYAARLDEIGVRAALGATAVRLRAQLAIEATAIAAFACLCGALFAFWSLKVLLSAMTPEQASVLRVTMGLPRLLAISTSFLLIWGPVSVACAHSVCKATPSLLQRSGGSLRDSPIGLNVQRRLLVVQTALACALLIAVALLTRSFDDALTAGLGRNAQRVAILTVDSPGGYGDVTRGTRFQQLALERVSRIPGVVAAAWASTLPLVEGPRRELSTSPDGPLVSYRTIFVSASYFRTMLLDVISGRSFEGSEDVPYAPGVIVNAAFAGRTFPNGAVGAQLFDADGGHPVLGVVSDDRYRRMEASAEPTVYRPLSSQYSALLHMFARGAVDASTLMPSIRTALDSVDTASVSRAESLAAHLAGALARDRVAVVLVRSCGLLVMLLSLSGAYLLSESIAARRRQEMALRLALGSTRLALVVTMLGRSLGLTVVGVGLGGVCAYAVAPSLRGVVGSLSLSDALLFLSVAGGVVGLSLVATAIPALVAARSVSPMAVLR